MRDPVLDRDMFRNPNDTESGGIPSIPKSASSYEERKRRAEELIALAKERQNPENFKTLAEQSRPGVFRPVATGQPQAPQPNTQQQLAQMQAMGFRPVGMADGGYVQHFADGSGPAGVTPYESIGQDPSLWTDQKIADFVFGEAEHQSDIIGRINTLKGIRDNAKRIIPGATRPYDQNESIWDKLINPVARRVGQALEDYENGEPVVSGSENALNNGLDVSGPEITINPFNREFWSPNDYGALPSERTPRKRETLPYASTGIASVPTETPKPAPETREGGTREGGTREQDTGENAPSRLAPKDTTPAPKTNIEDIKASRKENVALAMIQAGLAMAGGESPNALKNIAAGGISGIGAFSELEKATRAANLEERKTALQEKYYKDRADREQATIDQARRRNEIAMLNIYREAQASAAKEFETMVKADPQLGLDPVRSATVKKQLEDKYLRGLMINNSLGMGSGGAGAPSLNPDATDIFSE